MIRDDECYLISQNPDTHGVFDPPEETERMVLCAVRSVGANEFYRAKEYGLNPQLVFVLSDLLDYEGEKQLRYGDKRYDVIRTYCDGFGIELTVEEAKTDVQ